MKTPIREPWLVAAWPGMGAVAHLAVGYLVRALGAEPLREIPAEDCFDVGKVATKAGLLQPLRRPQTALLTWRNPGAGRDLVVVLGEQQPTSRPRAFCEEVIRAAHELGAVRAYTFAAMATPSAPDAPARVFAAASDASVLSELHRADVEVLEEGEIGGMNGVFVAEAAQRGLPGACLLGEIPYFANAVPNPKAAAAALRVFARHAGLELDLSDLDRQGRDLERQLVDHLRRLEAAARTMREAAAGGGQEGDEVPEDWPEPDHDELASEDAARVEELFAAAERDRSKALELKAELDRLDVFKRFEDRFLDLFKSGS